MSTETPPARKSSRLLLIAALVLSMAITAGSLFFILDRIINPGNTTSTGAAIVDSGDFFDGSTAIDPPREIGDFTLTGNDGQPLSLSDLRGKVTLLYFGYTHCPDVCPTTLNELRQVKRQSGQRRGQNQCADD